MELTKHEATRFFAELYYGEHHFPSKLKPFGQGWSMAHHGELATFDFAMLTRLVLMAHRYCIRVGVMQGGPGGVKISLHKRNREGESVWDRHPTIKEAIEINSNIM